MEISQTTINFLNRDTWIANFLICQLNIFFKNLIFIIIIISHNRVLFWHQKSRETQLHDKGEPSHSISNSWHWHLVAPQWKRHCGLAWYWKWAARNSVPEQSSNSGLTVPGPCLTSEIWTSFMVRRSPYGFLEQRAVVILDLHNGPHCAFSNTTSLKLLLLMLIRICGEFRPQAELGPERDWYQMVLTWRVTLILKERAWLEPRERWIFKAQRWLLFPSVTHSFRKKGF